MYQDTILCFLICSINFCINITYYIIEYNYSENLCSVYIENPAVKCFGFFFPDMHMMVSRPEQWVKPMAAAGASQYTFHLEATMNPGSLIKEIRENRMKVWASSFSVFFFFFSRDFLFYMKYKIWQKSGHTF